MPDDTIWRLRPDLRLFTVATCNRETCRLSSKGNVSQLSASEHRLLHLAVDRLVALKAIRPDPLEPEYRSLTPLPSPRNASADNSPAEELLDELSTLLPGCPFYANWRVLPTQEED
jgi:hypothetical protein